VANTNAARPGAIDYASRSSDFEHMARYWQKVDDLMGGLDAMRQARTRYIKRFPVESDEDYEFRISNAKLTNVYRDVVDNLAQRPFSKTVKIEDGSNEYLEAFSEDVDGRGSSLHSFASTVFFSAISDAMSWIFVDYTPDVPSGSTVEEERELGARPWWVHIPALDMLDVRTRFFGGREQVVYARWREDRTEVDPDTHREMSVCRVRILSRPRTGGTDLRPEFGRPLYEVWELGREDSSWRRVQDPQEITLDYIPLVPLRLGRRIGSSWRLHPPMQGAVDLQISVYCQETHLENVKVAAAFPMLAGNGVQPEIGTDGRPVPIKVGPGRVLYAPPNVEGQSGRWETLEPSATTMTFLASDIKDTIRELRELGRQPLTAQSGNLTVVTTQFAADKGNAAIQEWALEARECLEHALDITLDWVGQSGGDFNLEFDLEFDLSHDSSEAFGDVVRLRETRDISRDTVLREARRRSILGPDFNAEEDLEKLLEESSVRDDVSLDMNDPALAGSGPEADANGRNAVDAAQRAADAAGDST
jgi:hypothetical protein